jgi:hypothetical protein
LFQFTDKPIFDRALIKVAMLAKTERLWEPSLRKKSVQGRFADVVVVFNTICTYGYTISDLYNLHIGAPLLFAPFHIYRQTVAIKEF